MRVFEFQLMTAGDMSGSLASASQQLTQMAMCAIQASWSGSSPVGSLKLQISNDNTIWSDYTGSDVAVNGNGNFMWNILSTAFPYVRVAYTFTSGTGSLTIKVNGKGV
jgi:hypothetical protein